MAWWRRLDERPEIGEEARLICPTGFGVVSLSFLDAGLVFFIVGISSS